MYKRILVPIDGSQTSELALREAVRLADDQKAELRVIYVLEDIVPMWDVELLNIDEIRQAMRATGQRILKKADAAARAAGVKVQIQLVEASPPSTRAANMIVEEAKSWPADLIVIGTHGRRGVDHLLMGSVAEGVARISPVPVLLIRSK
jgi:nucleotide-binding universal stress UspA family protein